MTRSIPRTARVCDRGAGVTAAGYVGLVTGACPVDRHRPAGPAARPSAGRHGRAPRGRLRRHRRAVSGPGPPGAGRQAPGAGTRQRHGLGRPFHPLGGRLGLVAQTVETVRFTRPERVDFRLVRGPVPHVVEAFVLTEQAGGAGTRLAYDGEIGADLWLLGQRWCELVAGRWEQTVAASLAGVKAEAGTGAVECRGTPALQPRQSAPTHRLTAGTADPSTPRMPCS